MGCIVLGASRHINILLGLHGMRESGMEWFDGSTRAQRSYGLIIYHCFTLPVDIIPWRFCFGYHIK
jgi:hypothetical protein